MSDLANAVTDKDELPIDPTVDAAVEAAEPEVVDVDAIELAEAEAALAAEEAAAEGEPGGDVDPLGIVEPTPAATTAEPEADPATPAVQPAPAAGPMIPKGRFDEVLARGDKATMEAAYWKGRADANDAAVQPGQTAPGEPLPVAKSPQEQITEVRAAKVVLAEKFDNGEFTAPEWEAERQKLDDREFDIRAEAMPKPEAAVAAPAAAAPAAQNDLYLEEVTDQIASEHPYVELIGEKNSSPVAGHRWETLEKEAGLALQEKGVVFQFDQNGQLPPRQLILLREEVADLTDVYGPLWFPDAELPDPKTAVATTTPKAGTDAGEPVLTRRQKQRLEKLTLAGGQPPDSTVVGGTGAPQREYTEADILAMSEEELEALPEPLKRKFDPEYAA